MLSTEQLPEAAVVVDADGNVSAANALADACFGRSVEGCAFGELVPRPEALLSVLTKTADGERWEAELEGVRADGVPFPLDVCARIIDEGPPRRALLLLRDRNADAQLGDIARHQLDLAFDVSPIGMALYDTDGRFARVNPAMCTLLARSAEELLGTRDQEVTHEQDRAPDLAGARRILAGEIDHIQLEKRFVRPDGSLVWVIANMSFMRDPQSGRPLAWLGQFQDVTQHRDRAERDPLTGVFNRRRFEDVLDDRLRHGRRYGPPGVLIVFDLDGFKEINDRHGHVAGDEVLCAVAAAVGQRVRETDVLARLGGDEFAVVLPHAAGMEAQIVARAIVQLVRDLRFEFGACHVTASVGIAPFPEEASDPSTLLAAADAALYDVKRAGGDAFALRPPS